MNGKREVTAEMKSDSQARNVMANQPKLTPKSNKKVLRGSQLKKHLRSTELYGAKKKPRVYSEKELGIPTLNKAIVPGVINKKGKKGKKFVEDNDSVLLNRLIKTINDDRDLVNESKLEKSRRLEEIRDLRRQEMERKEDEKKEKLESAKLGIKQKANLARATRRKSAREAKREIEKDALKEVKSKKKSVSFA